MTPPVEFMGIGPLLDATLKLSMPVMCILSVEGLPAISTWPLFPLMADPLCSTRIVVAFYVPEFVDWGPTL